MKETNSWSTLMSARWTIAVVVKWTVGTKRFHPWCSLLIAAIRGLKSMIRAWCRNSREMINQNWLKKCTKMFKSLNYNNSNKIIIILSIANLTRDSWEIIIILKQYSNKKSSCDSPVAIYLHHKKQLKKSEAYQQLPSNCISSKRKCRWSTIKRKSETTLSSKSSFASQCPSYCHPWNCRKRMSGYRRKQRSAPNKTSRTSQCHCRKGSLACLIRLKPLAQVKCSKSNVEVTLTTTCW